MLYTLANELDVSTDRLLSLAPAPEPNLAAGVPARSRTAKAAGRAARSADRPIEQEDRAGEPGDKADEAAQSGAKRRRRADAVGVDAHAVAPDSGGALKGETRRAAPAGGGSATRLPSGNTQSGEPSNAEISGPEASGGGAADLAGAGPMPETLPETPERWRLLRSLPPSIQAQVQRAGTRQSIDFGSGVRWERLTTTSDSRVDFLEIVYAPGSSSDEFVGHEGSEYGIVIEGALTGRIGTEEYVLNAGDSISFASSTPHLYRNDGDVPARAIWFVLHKHLPGPH